MKKIILLLALTLCSITTFAVIVTGHVRATVVDGVQVAETQQLNFGTFDVTGEGTITIDPDGTRDVSPAIIPIGAGFSAGSFTITGAPITVFTFSLPSTFPTLVGTNTAQTIAVSALSASVTEGSTNANGTAIVKVGGTITLIGNQPTDNYVGTYDVIVAYQ